MLIHKKENILRMKKSKNLIVIFTMTLFLSCCSNSKEKSYTFSRKNTTTLPNPESYDRKNSFPEKNEDSAIHKFKCFEFVRDTINISVGCPSFTLAKHLKEQPNHVIVVNCNGILLKNDSCYKLNVNDELYKKFSFNVYIDKYIEKGSQKTYCLDIINVNAETPVRYACISGEMRFFIRQYDNYYEKITLQIINAEFRDSRGLEKSIYYPNIIFEEVVISVLPG